MASVGDDETLRMWDISKHSIIVSKNLGTQATCLSFSPDGNFLAVGLINGVFLLLESKVEKLNFGTYMEEYHPPSLDVIMSPKESKTAILNIKFSFRGDFIAISYDNEQKSNTDQIIANLSKFNQKDSDK
jgi:WD40 repeat protein